MAMNTPRREMSPKNYSDETGSSLANVSYHFRKLEKLGFIELVRTEQRRGATEHYYDPVKRAMAWSGEAEAIPPVILDGFSATILRGFVEEVGSAIDAGTFSDRDDRVLAWDKMWVDQEGWEQMVALFCGTLVTAMEIEAECVERREDGAAGFFMGYALGAFESPAPPAHP